jgi:hypothetical protein
MTDWPARRREIEEHMGWPDDAASDVVDLLARLDLVEAHLALSVPEETNRDETCDGCDVVMPSGWGCDGANLCWYCRARELLGRLKPWPEEEIDDDV